MNYLIINGSPHKGNTWKLAMAARKMIKKQDKEAKVSVIHLANCNLPFCCGCSNCFRKGVETCPHYAIVKRILERMEWADGLIVVSTAFCARETGILKNLIDHLCFLLHRPHFFTKKAMVITTAGGVGAKKAASEIAGVLRGIGVNRCYTFHTATISWNDYHPKKTVLRLLGRVTMAFCQDVQSKKLHTPGYDVLIPYNLFRGMAKTHEKGTKFPTEDDVYWAEEHRRNAVYDVRVPVSLGKRCFGQAFYWMGRIGGRLLTVTYKK